MSNKEKSKDSKEFKKKDLIAKKDHVIFQNGLRIVIKEGCVVDVPERFIPTLKAEKVI